MTPASFAANAAARESRMRMITLLLVAVLGSSSAWAQTGPQMRTRLLTSLTNTEVEQYLKRNDVIFIPVGTVEPHGGLPIDCEYVGPLAYAIKMAEATDGLVLPGMAYFFPDATIVGRGAVHVTPSEGTPYLMAVARSLLRQGFRRQVYITGHGPSFQTVSPLVRQFYDTHVPIVHLESSAFRRPGPGVASGAAASPTLPVPGFSAFDAMLFGAYVIAGRLEDIPVNLAGSVPEHAANPGVNDLFPLGPQSGTIGFYMSDATDHGGAPRPITSEQRAAIARAGVEMIEQTVRSFDMKGVLEAMREHDKFTQQHILPTYGWIFPR